MGTSSTVRGVVAIVLIFRLAHTDTIQRSLLVYPSTTPTLESFAPIKSEPPGKNATPTHHSSTRRHHPSYDTTTNITINTTLSGKSRGRLGKTLKAFRGPGHFSRVKPGHQRFSRVGSIITGRGGSDQGDPARPVRSQNLLTRPDRTRSTRLRKRLDSIREPGHA